MIVELNSVYKDYYQGKMTVPVLKDINFSVEEGEYVAIMGPSGSGKTTLMNLIGCLDVPTSGEYILDGQKIEGLDDKTMAGIRNTTLGFVFQRFHLLPKQNALSNVMLPLSYSDIPQKKWKSLASEALEKVGLSDRMNFLPNQMSGGQCQRVAIARAMVCRPKILLADEPTGALDTDSGNQVMALFEQLSRDGVTIIMITHEPEIAQNAERIMHIRDGVLTERMV